MAEKEVRKTTAKKTVRRSTTKVAPRKTAARKTAEAPLKSPAPARKAPARVAPTPASGKRGSKKFLIAAVILFVILGASIAIGFTDKGQIDVTSVIATRKQNATGDEQQALESVPVQQGQSGVVNGGLVGTGAPSPLVPTNPAPESASSTASTTSETGTTTEPIITPDTSEETEQQTAPQNEGAVEGTTAEEGVADPIPQ